MKPGEPKLALLSRLAAANASMHRTQEAVALFQFAMDLGEARYARYTEENHGAMSYTAPGFDDLTSLVEQVAADRDAFPTVVARVRLVEDDILRARRLRPQENDQPQVRLAPLARSYGSIGA